MEELYKPLKKNDKPIHNLRPSHVNVVISVVAVATYSVLFFAAYQYLKNGIVSGMALAPALIIGWLYGKRAGVLGGFFLSGWNMLLFVLVGASGLKLTLLGPGLMGSLFLVSMGGAAGWVSRLLQRVRRQAEDLALEVAERRRIEQELRASEAYNRAIVTAFPDMIFVLNQEGTFLTYQASNSADLYLPPDKITHSNIKDVMPGEFVQLCLQCIAQAFETNTAQVFEYQLPMSEGMRDYEARLVKINDDSVLAVVRNMTTVKQAQQQQIMMAVQQERIKMLNELIDNLSHDFKTPLSVINTSLYLLHYQVETEEAKKRLEKIQQQSMRIEKYVEAILTLSRLDNQPHLHLESLSLGQILQPLITDFQAIAKQHSIHIEFQWDDALPLIVGDYHTLKQALAHLINNAITYNHTGGAVTVRGHVAQHRGVIEIKDTGIGIDPAYYGRIFERFYRLDPARSSDVGGIGLGLAIVQKIIELNRGEIEVESQPNDGTMFRVYLPTTEYVVSFTGTGNTFR